MSFPLFIKDPDAVLDYAVDWTTWLDGDTIVASTWILDEGITEHTNTTFTTKNTILWVSGGTVNMAYLAVNHITTAAGRENDQTIRLQIREK